MSFDATPRCHACHLAYVGERDQDGTPQGHGLLTVSTRDLGGGLRASHLGLFHRGQRHGIGKTSLLDNKICLSGEWYEDEMCGSGHISVSSCFWRLISFASFEGSMTASLPEGLGILIWHSGHSYAGYFRRGLRDGSGTLYDANKRRLVTCASWIQDVPNGRCEFCRMPNESVYVGLITNGEFGPLGKLYDFEGGTLIYDGQFLRGIPHGRGTMRSLDPPYIYEGLFSQGRRHGDGSIRFPDGAILFCQWKNDSPFGNATLTSKRDRIVKRIKLGEDETTGNELFGHRWSESTFIVLDALYWGNGSNLKIDICEWRYLADCGQGHWAEHAAHVDTFDESALSEAETIAPPNEDISESKLTVRILIHRAEGLVTYNQPYICQLKLGDETRQTRAVGGSHPEWREILELPNSAEGLLMFKIIGANREVVGGCFSNLDDFQEVMQLTGKGADGIKGYAGRLQVEKLPPRRHEFSEDDFTPTFTQTIRAQTSTHNHNVNASTLLHNITLQTQPTI